MRRSNLRAKDPAGTVEQRVFAELREGDMSTAELAAALGLLPKAVRRATWDLRKRGYVEAIGRGNNMRYQRVPGAKMPPDRRGKSVVSHANLRRTISPKTRDGHRRWRAAGSPRRNKQDADALTILQRRWTGVSA